MMGEDLQNYSGSHVMRTIAIVNLRLQKNLGRVTHTLPPPFATSLGVAKGASPGRPRTLEENVERIRQTCVRNPKRSIARLSLALGIPKTTIQNVLHKRLRLHAYKIQLMNEIKPEDKLKRVEFATFMMLKIDDDESFLNRILFTDEATFHISGCVNRHNCRIWGSHQPTETHQYVRCSPKVNVWCGLLYDRVVGPFFITETSITGNIYQDLLEIYVFPQIDDLEAVTGNNIVFMQDGAA
ncbi:hypothetical protein AVEN_110205-1 [Araneus ventricosus]|uniref:Uncharacterized protein n=1 Tax=Araneus ventricosus TaxID=182803 RepID=A0A4Y2FE19_ARAVE|nr:hypothetical protein AVEN_110205-1 [Araneus ventricosus]